MRNDIIALFEIIFIVLYKSNLECQAKHKLNNACERFWYKEVDVSYI